MGEITEEEIDDLVDAANLLTFLQGPQRARHLYEFAGYVHEHESDECPDDCRQSRGLLVWIHAVGTGRLIGDGQEHGNTAWRPYRDGEPYVMVGQVRHTPRSAIWAQAKADQEEAELAAMTDEDWAEAERNVAEIQQEIDTWRAEEQDR